MTTLSVGAAVDLPTVSVAIDDDAVILYARGDLCAISTPVLVQALDAAIQAGVRRIVVDLAEVTLLSAAALGAFASATNRQRERDGEFKLRAPSRQARRVLVATGLDALVEADAMA